MSKYWRVIDYFLMNIFIYVYIKQVNWFTFYHKMYVIKINLILTIFNYILWDSTYKQGVLCSYFQGRIQGGGRKGPPWIFIILRERPLSLTTAIEKETKRSYDGQGIPLPLLLNRKRGGGGVFLGHRNSRNSIFFLSFSFFLFVSFSIAIAILVYPLFSLFCWKQKTKHFFKHLRYTVNID